jgi:hypothetical protein
MPIQSEQIYLLDGIPYRVSAVRENGKLIMKPVKDKAVIAGLKPVKQASSDKDNNTELKGELPPPKTS